MVEMRDKEDLDDPDMAILASTFMIGGAETTAAIMQWFSALIPVYPEIQNQPRKNSILLLDVTISLVSKMNKICLTAMLSLKSEDCVYREKYIPKETVVVLNTWTMHYDPTRHSNPETFDPDRYINDPLTSAESANVANPMERDHWMFGAGRRICPGMLGIEI
ncbi:hypothetical protein AFLA_009784 [Aspergillus flavus NRRL3357]|nr:hypothetical protein AFLA_009784 [Aspergillus flavus NRRL3357]